MNRDPEGNTWTVTCSCGAFEESTSCRREARNEGRFHLDRVLHQLHADNP